MILNFRPIKVWPDGWRDDDRDDTRQYCPFDASYSDTLEVLDRELRALGCTDVVLQVDAGPGQVRIDGQLRADAKVEHPGVILTIETDRFGTLIYATDRFRQRGYRSKLNGWQGNLRAVALGLEALRKVERYGIAERGQQYAGYRELGSGIAMGAGPEAMTVEQAARILADAYVGGPSPDDVLLEVGMSDKSWTRDCYRMGAKHLHPDAGGDPEAFRLLTQAYERLVAA